MGDDEEIEAITRHFSDCGFQVERIPPGDEKTPDLLLIQGGQRFLVELKSRFDDDEEADRVGAELERGVVASTATTFEFSNKVSKMVRKAADQLRNHPDPVETPRVVLLWARGTMPEAQEEVFHSTLFGTQRIAHLTARSLVPAYFFHESAFFRCRSVLAGAIIVSGDAIEFWLNPFSPRYEILRDSALAVAFSGGNDPRKKEALGEAYIVDGAHDRRDQAASLAFLQEKYELGPIDTFNLGAIRAYVRSDSDPDLDGD